MGLRDLSSEVMVTITADWIDPEKTRPWIEKIPVTAALLPNLEEAHRNVDDAMLVSVGATSPYEAEIQENRTEATIRDHVHDRKSRGSWLFLSALAELADDPTDEQELLALRDRMIPKGPSTTVASYLTEYAHAETLAKQLDAPTRKLLRQYKTLHKSNLEDEIEAWMRAGSDLGALEKRHAELVRLRDEASATSSPRMDLVKARHQWIRAVNAFLANLDIARDIERETLARIVGPLERALDQAERAATGSVRPDEAPREEGEEPAEAAAKPPKTAAKPKKKALARATSTARKGARRATKSRPK